jgi:hypothetical protein
MAWAELAPKIDSLMESLELNEAEGLFNIGLIPATRADRSYCLWPDSLMPNTEFPDQSDRFYPINQFRVSVIFELGDNRKSLRDAMMKTIEDIVSVVILPDNRAPRTRSMRHIGSKTKLWRDEGTWAIADIVFTAQYEVK